MPGHAEESQGLRITGAGSETALLRAAQEWELTFNSVPDLIAILDTEHRIRRVNRAMAQRLGLEPEQCLGLPCFRCVHGAEHAPAFCPHTLTIQDGCEHVAEVHEERLGGDFLMSTTPLVDSQGQVVGSVHIARDITQLKQAERALRQAKEELAAANEELERKVQQRTTRLQETIAELETFSYSVAHDLRAPLRSMQGMAAALLEDYSARLDSQGQDYLRRIMAAAVRQDRLIQDVLRYSQVARREIELSKVDLDQLVQGVLLEYPNLQEHRGHIHVRSPLAPVRGHAPSLVQCISNLLENALKFVSPGKTPDIQVWTESTSSQVRLWISDNGIGIAPEDTQRIFRLFERLHGSQDYPGTGIGLAVVQKAIERMGGRVGVNSQLGHGSRFWIELPVA